MADKATVSITGLDSTLILIEGKFSSALDRRVLNTQGNFVKRMDKAASRVFEAMAKDISVNGIVARRVIGSHANTPSFLISEGATPWERLTPKYEKQKKKKLGNRNYWQYTGSMLRTFRTQSKQMLAMSDNSLRNQALGEGKYRPRYKNDPNDSLFLAQKTVPAYGRNIGTRGKNYDFIYDEQEKAPVINYSALSKKTGAVPEKYVKQMRRQVSFNLFNGYARYVSDMLNGTVSSSPEDYIAFQRSGTQTIKKPTKAVISDPTVAFKTDKFERRLFLKHKLWYRRDGQLKKRDLVQPYMRYYFKRVMLPLAKKLLTGMKV